METSLEEIPSTIILFLMKTEKRSEVFTNILNQRDTLQDRCIIAKDIVLYLT